MMSTISPERRSWDPYKTPSPVQTGNIKKFAMDLPSTPPSLPNVAPSATSSKNQISNHNSDTSSTFSLESTNTEDDAADSPYHTEESSTWATPWAQQLNPRKFIDPSKLGLSSLSSETATKLRAALDVLFKSWSLPVASFPNASGVDSTHASFGSFASQTHTRSTTTNRRGKKMSEDGDEDEFPNPPNNNPRKRKRPNEDDVVENLKKWACPFYQRQFCIPHESGDFRKCIANPGFEDVHRIKAHLYKYHSPVYCNRCYSTFRKAEELEGHQRRETICDVMPQALDGLTSAQIISLKPRDRSGRREEERWKTIYRICFPFPNEEIPSPYYGYYSEDVTEKECVKRKVQQIIWQETGSSELVQRVSGAFNPRALRTISNPLGGMTSEQNPSASSISQPPRNPEFESLDYSSFQDFPTTFIETNGGLFDYYNSQQFENYSAISNVADNNENDLPEQIPGWDVECNFDWVLGSDGSNKTFVNVYEDKDLDMEGPSSEG